MGRERTRTRKHVYFCIVSLIFILLAGCAIVKEMREQAEARDALLRGRRLLAKGDFGGALKENQKALSFSGDRSPRDEALFHTGLIYAHNDNPSKDYRKALGFFRRLIDDYPQSPLITQAKIWVGVLEEDWRLNQVIGQISRENDTLIQEKEDLIHENQKSSQVIEKLKQVIKKSKQVDIEIEEKKRLKEK